MSTPKRRKVDKRPTLTLKGESFTPEFRALLNKAAKKQGLTQSAFVAEVLNREARRILQGPPSGEPMGTPPPPAVLEKVEATDRRVRELAQQVQRLSELQQRTFWQKLREAFG